MSYSKKIKIEIEGVHIEVDIIYDYTPAEPAIMDLPPEHCQEGFEEEYEILDLIFPEPDGDIIDKLKDVIIHRIKERD